MVATDEDLTAVVFGFTGRAETVRIVEAIPQFEYAGIAAITLTLLRSNGMLVMIGATWVCVNAHIQSNEDTAQMVTSELARRICRLSKLRGPFIDLDAPHELWQYLEL